METIELKDLVGTMLTATDPCYMDGYSGRPYATLIVGKEYEIIDYRGDCIIVKDEEGDDHLFTIQADGTFETWECNVTGKVVEPFAPLRINIELA
jgi:hypothetical protein